jgi:RNA polymerase sigma factor (sigma-70 family)
VACGDSAACENLYLQFSSYRRFFGRSVERSDADDLFHELIIDVVTQIQNGLLREPARLAGYVRVIAIRKLRAFITERSRARTFHADPDTTPLQYGGDDPEAEAIARENRSIALRILTDLPARDRDVLIRFYLHGEPAERIQADLSLTPTQFRLIKSRAKQRFTEQCKHQLGNAPRHVA